MNEEEKMVFWGDLVEPITRMMGKLAVSGNWKYVELLQDVVAKAENAALEEREACAKICEEPWQGHPYDIAKQIRARSKHE